MCSEPSFSLDPLSHSWTKSAAFLWSFETSGMYSLENLTKLIKVDRTMCICTDVSVKITSPPSRYSTRPRSQLAAHRSWFVVTGMYPNLRWWCYPLLIWSVRFILMTAPLARECDFSIFNKAESNSLIKVCCDRYVLLSLLAVLPIADKLR
jgi:hypothetical protein